MKEELVSMEEWQNRVQQDINDLKNSQSRMDVSHAKVKDDIRDLQMSDKMQNQEINTLKENLTEIKDDTNWIRRKITGAIITATITAVVAGVIGVAIANIL
jgi:uncharacterized coiled-coil DUF342 family protein